MEYQREDGGEWMRFKNRLGDEVSPGVRRFPCLFFEKKKWGIVITAVYALSTATAFRLCANAKGYSRRAFAINCGALF